MSIITFVRIVDRESTNRAMSNNGGDYDFGRTIAVQYDRPIGVRYWTSADFPYCPKCGQFDSHTSKDCPVSEASMADAKGWESGAPITDQRAIENNRFWLENGKFSMMPWA